MITSLYGVFEVVSFQWAAFGRRLPLLCSDGCEWTLVCISCHMNLEWYSTDTCHTLGCTLGWTFTDKVLLLLSDSLKISTQSAVHKLHWEITIIYSFWEIGFEIEPWICVLLFLQVFVQCASVLNIWAGCWKRSNIDEYQVSNGVTDSKMVLPSARRSIEFYREVVFPLAPLSQLTLAQDY